MEKYVVQKKVKKWGYSLIVVLGRSEREITNLKPGDIVTVTIEYEKESQGE